MTSDVDIIYAKVINIDTIYNFVVDAIGRSEGVVVAIAFAIFLLSEALCQQLLWLKSICSKHAHFYLTLFKAKY